MRMVNKLKEGKNEDGKKENGKKNFLKAVSNRNGK